MIDKKKIAGIVLAGIITVTGATSAFAADVTADAKAPFQRQLFKIDKTEVSAKIKSAVDKLVAAGTITQVQADEAVKAYTPGARPDIAQGKFQMKFRSPMGGLVAKGTITQAQADAISSAVKAGIEDKKTPEDVIKELVSAGTITQAQADAVSKCFSKIPAKSGDRLYNRNPMSRLVAAGTITQAQADGILKAIKTGISEKKAIDDIIKELVSEGTITQAQADAIQKVFPLGHGRFIFKDQINMDNTAKADIIKERIKNGALIKHGKNPLAALVSDGTLTQAQADAINEAVKAALRPVQKQ